MSWIEKIISSINYIEQHIEDDLTVEDIANSIHLSPFYFQKGFSILCGISVSEYLRNRRLSLAGRDLKVNGEKVIDVAIKYGYDSPDSFAKAFTRFHGISPSQAKKGEGKLKQYLPLKIHISLKGGFEMEYKIVEKPSFTVIGCSKIIKNEEGYAECPKFWNDHFSKGNGKYISGMYGICIDGEAGGAFKYMIADDYVPAKNLPEKFETFVVPEGTWAIFPCRGAMPNSLQEVNTKIFTDWLPGNPEYELNGMCTIEYYTDVTKYPKGNDDENYYSEIWLPIKTKKL